MLIAQISDFHVGAPEGFGYGLGGTRRMLDLAVAAVNRLEPQPDLVVCTGDLAQAGQADEYAEIRMSLGSLRAPFAPLVGNHDDRKAFREAFGEALPALGPAPFVQYVVDLDAVRLIVIDTVTEGSDQPSFCQARADWLAGALETADKPVVVAMHHPPFNCGVAWLEADDPEWAARLAVVLKAAPPVVRLLAGHVHRAIQTTWNGVPASTAPSTAHQVFPDLSGGEPLYSLEAPGFQLHRWTGRDLTTYTASTIGFGDTFPVHLSGEGAE